ncbi:MAG: heavy metal translocating P-type ATPase [Aestuariivirga sp.]
MSCCAGSLSNELAREITRGREEQIVQDLQNGAKTLQDGTRLYTLSVPSIHCGQCISTIEKKLKARPEVKSARANLSLRRVSVTLDEAQSPAFIVQTLDSLGYPSQSIDDEGSGEVDQELTILVRSLAVSGFAAANIMLLSVSVWAGTDPTTTQFFHFVSALIAIPTVVYAGRPFFRSALGALMHRRMNMDVPISLGVILATAMSLYETFSGAGHAYFDAAVSLLFFLLIGRSLDYVMRAKARDAVGRLARLAAKGGLVVSGNGEVNYLPLEGIRPGMIVRVAAGERVPVDGTIVDGVSDVDRSLVTGEAASARLGQGVSLEAGTLNLTGSIDLRAERDAKDSFLADVLQMMQAAEKGRGQYLRLADRMAKLYAPAVHLLALLTFVGWMIATHGNWHNSITTAISVLIITCPCAFGLAVPVAHVLAASRLFSLGTMMKDGSALERLAEIDTIVFDKTGTLTSNIAQIRKNTIPTGRLSSIAKTLALRSIHPAAKALAKALPDAPMTNFTGIHEIPGFGVEGQFNGQVARLGQAQWVSEITSEASSNAVTTGLGFALAGTPLYIVQLQEALRQGAASVVQAFAKRGIKSEILSGDVMQSVQRVALAVGVTDFKFALKPGEKLLCLKELAGQGHKTFMVGDGLNDAPALSAAHCSMAPASGSDTGRMAADFVFMRDDLMGVWQTYVIAKKADRIVKQNFALALIYNTIAVPMAIFGALNPFIAALAMSSSSILVVANSMRLRWVRIDAPISVQTKIMTEPTDDANDDRAAA